MSNAIQSIDLQTVTDKLRERIQSAFVDVIPEEQWTSMIAAEIQSFFKPTQQKTRDDYGREDVKEAPPPFTKIVHAEVEKLLKEQLKTELSNLASAGSHYIDGQHTVGDFISRWLKQHHKVVVHAVIEKVFGNTIQEFLRQASYRG